MPSEMSRKYWQIHTHHLMMATLSDRLHLHLSHGLEAAFDEFCRAKGKWGKKCCKKTCWCIGHGTQVFCFLKIRIYHYLDSKTLWRAQYQHKYSLPEMCTCLSAENALTLQITAHFTAGHISSFSLRPRILEIFIDHQTTDQDVC